MNPPFPWLCRCVECGSPPSLGLGFGGVMFVLCFPLSNQINSISILPFFMYFQAALPTILCFFYLPLSVFSQYCRSRRKQFPRKYTNTIHVHRLISQVVSGQYSSLVCYFPCCRRGGHQDASLLHVRQNYHHGALHGEQRPT